MSVLLLFELAPGYSVSHLPFTASFREGHEEIVLCEAIAKLFLQLVSPLSHVFVAAGVVDPDETFLLELVVSDGWL